MVDVVGEVGLVWGLFEVVGGLSPSSPVLSHPALVAVQQRDTPTSW